MKKFSLMICLASILAFGLQAQDAKDAGKTADKNKPVIEFDKTTHDYGVVKYEGDGSYEFKFTNKGKEPLVLTEVRSSCGCTVPEWPREPIAKGKSASIKVKYNTRIVGSFTKSITVFSNATQPSVSLTIKGNVESRETAAQ
jgi:hypothetical protein